MNDVRANIKIKKKRKINLLTPRPCWATELQRWKKRKRRRGGGRGVGGWEEGWRRPKVGEREREREGGGGGEECEEVREGLKLLAVGGIVSLGLILDVLQCLFVLLFFTKYS